MAFPGPPGPNGPPRPGPMASSGTAPISPGGIPGFTPGSYPSNTLASGGNGYDARDGPSSPQEGAHHFYSHQQEASH